MGAVRMIIDAHNHPDWWGKDLNQVIANMDEYHIDKTWILSWECPEDEYDPDQKNVLNEYAGINGGFPIPFSRCLAYKRAWPDRFVLGYAPDPRNPSAIDRLEAAVNLYGVRVCGEIKLRMMYDNPDALQLFRWCGEKRLPVTLHLEYPIDTGRKYPRRSWWYGGDMDTLERVLQKCPETTFLGHALAFWASISADDKGYSALYPTGRVVREGKLVRLLRSYPNLYCDISANSGYNAFHRDPEYAREFITEFQDRIVYARDLFANKHQEMLNSLGLPKEVLDKVYFQNACRLIGEKAGGEEESHEDGR